MKAFKILLSLVTVFLIFSITSCKKNKNIAPIEQLPPETQTGKNTFGCLVDGKVFLPKGSNIGPILLCQYQYLNSNNSIGYFFGLHAQMNTKKEELFSISISVDSSMIKKGESYPLVEARNGFGTAQYTVYPNPGVPYINYLTTDDISGKLTISEFDEINQIVSGTFWFNAINGNGDMVKVTDGRFDMQYIK